MTKIESTIGELEMTKIEILRALIETKGRCDPHWTGCQPQCPFSKKREKFGICYPDDVLPFAKQELKKEKLKRIHALLENLG
jgi:hypothetical protein